MAAGTRVKVSSVRADPGAPADPPHDPWRTGARSLGSGRERDPPRLPWNLHEFSTL